MEKAHARLISKQRNAHAFRYTGDHTSRRHEVSPVAEAVRPSPPTLPLLPGTDLPLAQSQRKALPAAHVARPNTELPWETKASPMAHDLMPARQNHVNPRPIINVTPGHREPRKWRWPRFGVLRRWMPNLPSWVFVVISFAALNVAIVGAQKFWHQEDQQRLDTLKAEISIARLRLCEQEASIRLIASDIARMAEQIDNGGTTAIEHNALVTRYNERMSLYKAVYADYSINIESANNKIDEANALSRKIGGTWYLIPVPRGGGLH